MKKEKICAFVLLVMTFLSFCGCKEEMISPLGGCSCLFVNHSTKDSILVSGDINIGDLQKIHVHNGDILEITFIPDRDFKKYNFAVVYTLMDGTQHSCTNHNYTYKFTVSDWGTQDGTLSFNANSTDKNINIIAGGAINVIMLESESSDGGDIPSDDKASVELTYIFECDSDFVRFITPEIIYTDKIGEHKLTLNEGQWSPITYAYCYCTENGTTHYEIFTLENGATVPEPWQIEYAYSFFKWEQAVKLDKVGITNNFVVRYHRKTDYVIETERTYELGHNLYCDNGHSSFVSEEGKIIVNTYNSTSIDIGGKTTCRGDEVQEYVAKCCAQNDTISMNIDCQGRFTLLSRK